MFINNYRIFKISIWLFIVATCLYLLPFITLISGSQIRNYFFREISYRILYNDITSNCDTDSSIALSLYTYVKNTVSKPPKNYGLNDVNPFEILVSNYAHCNQMSHILITLAKQGNIKGNLLFLYGNDSISRHSVCELQINNSYRIFDPFYQKIVYTKNNSIAGFADIQNGNIHTNDISASLPHAYFRLYENKFPPKVYLTNESKFPESISENFISIWCTLSKNILTKYYIHSYFYFDHSNEDRKKRIMNLLHIS